MLRPILGALAALLLASPLAAHADSFESADAPGLCLTVAVGASSIQPCDGSASQDFAIHEDQQSGQSLLVIGLACISMPAQGQMLGLSECSDPAPPSALFDIGGALSANGLCADVKGGGRKPGTRVIAFPCNGQRNQTWIQRQSGTTTQSGFDRVMASAATGRLSVNSNPSLCITIGAGKGAEVQPCGVAPLFHVIVGGSPTFVMFADVPSETLYCLSPSGNQGRQLQFADCRSAATTGNMGSFAKWGFTEKGLLRNEASLCADAEGGGKRPGTPVILFKCSGDANQRFTLIGE